ncbi:MAG: glycosyltransferase [Candidatus Thorarchaeota archaeon]
MKKKVVILVPSLELGGGAEKVASVLSNHLIEKYDIHIITLFHFENKYPFKGKYYSLKERKFIFNPLLRILKLYKLIKLISPDIILTFMNKTSFWAIPTVYLFNLNIPLLILINTNPDSHYKKRIYGKFLIRFLFPLKKINLLIPVSKELKKILNINYRIDNRKIIPIYTGIDTEGIKNLAKEEIDEYKEIFEEKNLIKFITMGRLSPEKGHKYLIEAFSQLVKEIPNSKVFILGEGSLRVQLEQQISLKKLQNHIFLLGFKENPYKFISNSDVFVLSSLHEGLPYSLIEALACGTPIISTDCETGPKEILENGKYGLLVRVMDVDDLKQKMIYLAKDQNLRNNLSRYGLERVRAFDNQKFFDNWDKLINYFLKEN